MKQNVEAASNKEVDVEVNHIFTWTSHHVKITSFIHVTCYSCGNLNVCLVASGTITFIRNRFILQVRNW